MAASRIVVAMTGASGMPYALRLLELLRAAPEIEPHLILSNAALQVLELESGLKRPALEALAEAVYGQEQLAAGPASGSWRHKGMVVCPCSMASLAAIANGLGSNLIHRAADVTLKERRRLVLVTRETPLNRVHLTNMLAANDAGATILPACPGFYHAPQGIGELVDQVVGRILDHLDISLSIGPRWQEA